MTTSRRDFIRTSAVAAAGVAIGSRTALGAPLTYLQPPGADPFVDSLALEGLNAAKAAGATYADVRIGRYRRQFIGTRERQVTGVSDSESYGIGIRTLVGGSWGFSATSVMTHASVQQTARDSVRVARAAKTLQRRPLELSPLTPVKGRWIIPIVRDPHDVPI
jgi:TldD protein